MTIASTRLTGSLQLPPHNNMPKEKVTRGKGRASKADGGKKKKGKSFMCIAS